jgi:hypothetical protein
MGHETGDGEDALGDTIVCPGVQSCWGDMAKGNSYQEAKCGQRTMGT